MFTTRPDTLFGATYMVLAPEHPLLDEIVPSEWPDANLAADLGDMPPEWKGIFGIDVLPPEAVQRYREFAEQKSELERQAEGREKTGVFTGAFAKNPTNGWNVPIFVADYVLMGYGTGAIMAVPAHDQRDFEFAREFDLPIAGVVRPPDGWLRERGVDADTPADEWPEAYVGDGVGMNSSNDEVSLDGLPTPEAKQRIAEWLEASEAGEGAVIYKLHDWLFSRQRYWGEPFPIVYDDDGNPLALPESLLPVELPEMTDFEPRILADDDPSPPEPPLARADDWVNVELDLGDGVRRYRRETNTMPQWAGSCWYYLRYLDPTNDDKLVDPALEQYWMGTGDSGGVDLYVGGAEHAVLHLLYARFWHKVLYDLGHVSTPEPFHRLYNQGTLTAFEYLDERGMYVEANDVEEVDGQFLYAGQTVDRRQGRMGKSRKNMVTPDEIYRDYGADTLRLYEMFMGPLDADRVWSTADIAGVYRFLQRFWRNVVDEDTGEPQVSPDAADDETRRLLHRTIACGSRRHGNARVQHRDREALRDQQPSHAGGRRAGERARGSRARDGPDARSAHASRRRGVVGESSDTSRRSRSSVSRARPRAPRRSRSRDPGASERQGARPRTRRDRCRRHRARSRRARRRAHRCAAGRGPVRKVVVVPGRLVNFVLR